MSFSGKDRKYRRYFASAGSQRYHGINILMLTVLFVIFVLVCCVSVYDREENNMAADNNDITGISDTAVNSSTMVNDGIVGGVWSDAERVSEKEYFPDHIPAQGVITDGYGYRTDPDPSYHYALDIAGTHASPVYAAASGRVEVASEDDIYGKHVVLNHMFDGYKSKYAHLCAYLVTAGQYVEKGEIIGFMGSTGYSTGTHLHFEIIKYNERLDPAKFILIIDGRTQL